MTQQQTPETGQGRPEPDATADRTVAADRAAAQDRPIDTRDLRDAQSGAKMTAADERPSVRAEGEAADAADPDAPLFEEAVATKLRERWMAIQSEFVDEPRGAVKQADSLVAEVLKQLTDSFAHERDELEAGWSSRGGDGEGAASTEELRQAIRRYRSFFNRLLAV